jgi:putative transcriptional regulator
MPVVVTLSEMLDKRNMTGRELARVVRLSETQMSQLKSGKVKGIRFETVARLCAALECTPGDLFGYEYDKRDLEG